MDHSTLEKKPPAATPLLRRLDQLPGPRGLPVFGNALQIDTSRFHLQLEAWSREFGPFFRLRLGNRKVLVVAGTVVISLLRRDSVSDTHVRSAAAFEPGRWLAEGGPRQMASSAKRTSMPFGAGPRICPGRYLALLEMKMAMATLLGRFDIASVDTPDGREAREHLSFTMTPVGLRMRLRERA